MVNHTQIEEYVQREILPLYEAFDAAHGPDHVHYVIERSLVLAEEYPVDVNMVYVIAAYHDIGLCHGREHHHTVSREMLMKDQQLNQWFTPEQIEIMAQAVEDHRASNAHEPTTIYGKIVAEADRGIEYHMILRRMIQYSLKNFPDYTHEEHFERCYSHMKDKYGRGGYLKLWLDSGENRRNLDIMQIILEDREQVHADFTKMMTTIQQKRCL